MTKYVEGVELDTTTCASCAMLFSMPALFLSKRRDDGKTFYCPAGHHLHFGGPTEAERLKRDLARKAEMLDAANARAATAEREKQAVTKAHKKMRVRVMNGVCPCCNRTFQNLMQHMKSQHPDFTEIKTIAALRQAFSMTQAAVAKEAGVPVPYVSQFEHGRYVPEYAREALEGWINKHAGATP